MDQVQDIETPVRVGVFANMADADRAVQNLLAAGFTKDEITVICSNKAVGSHFREFDHQDPAGAHAPEGAMAGGAVGAVLGGLVAVASVAATGGVALLAAGAAAGMLGGSVAGGLVGAMSTRGIEKGAADFYDQAVISGRILVAAEDHGPDQQVRLAQASRIIEEAGAVAVPLPEG